jgi:crotonobetainyl-CoA:carnitine CoA-transferase CaiB-like acyl-CoA transferase
MSLLSGLKVLDLSRVLAGPLCTMMLGDLGAFVIKVERSGRGDDTRGWGPPFDSRGESAYFLAVNRNKASLAADLSRPADREVVLALIREADVVVENFRFKALDALGIVAAEELERNEELIWCSITGFGAGSRRPGYDFVTQAEMGWMAITGEPAGEPMKAGVALADVVAGKDATVGILAAVAAGARARSRGASLSPRDRLIEISLARSAAASLVNVAQNTLVSGGDARRWGNAHANLVPYQLFAAADRPLVIAVGSDDQWGALLHVIGPEGLDSQALSTNAGRLAARDEVVSAIAGRIAQRTAGEWKELLDGEGVPCGVVRSVLEVVREAGGSPLTGMPPAVGATLRLDPPMLDEQGAEIRRRGWRFFDDCAER